MPLLAPGFGQRLLQRVVQPAPVGEVGEPVVAREVLGPLLGPATLLDLGGKFGRPFGDPRLERRVGLEEVRVLARLLAQAHRGLERADSNRGLGVERLPLDRTQGPQMPERGGGVALGLGDLGLQLQERRGVGIEACLRGDRRRPPQRDAGRRGVADEQPHLRRRQVMVGAVVGFLERRQFLLVGREQRLRLAGAAGPGERDRAGAADADQQHAVRHRIGDGDRLQRRRNRRRVLAALDVEEREVVERLGQRDTVVACAQQDDRPLERAACLVGALHPAEQGAQRRQDPGLRFAVVAGELQGALEAHQSVVGAVEVIPLHRAKVAQGIDFAGAIAQRGEPSYRGLEQRETGGRIAR